MKINWSAAAVPQRKKWHEEQGHRIAEEARVRNFGAEFGAKTRFQPGDTPNREQRRYRARVARREKHKSAPAAAGEGSQNRALAARQAPRRSSDDQERV